ncbi:MAG: type II secretion system F family protein [Chloroflexi bacterium]|nr:type II secretion system F family protein [Chloroflexota bacterium]
MDLTIGLSLLAFLAIFLLFFGIDRAMSSHTDAVESRLDRYASRPKVAKEAAAAGEAPQAVGRLNRMLVSPSRSQNIATDLAQADLKLTPQEYVMINLAAVLIGFVLMLIITPRNLILALVGGIVGFYAPRFYVRRLQSKRLQAFNNQLGDTLILLSNSLRSGYSLLQSMETVSKELSAPMSIEFGRVVREVGLGLTAQEALGHMLERIHSEDLDLVITAINIQHEVGGNLAEILDTIAHTIRERVRIKGQIRALTASQRLSGNIVALLPIGVGLFLAAFNPSYVSALWTQSCGLIMLVVGLIMIVSGYMVIRKITAIEV